MTLDDRYVTATPEGVALDVVLAGLGSRFAALLLDTVIQLGALIAFSIVVALVGNSIGGETGSLVAGGGAALFALLDILGYFVICEMCFGGRTVGKMLLGLRVIRVGGGPVGFWSSLLRNVLRFVDFLPSVYLVGCILILTTERNQRLGDLAGSTLVIRERIGAAPDPRAVPWSSAAGFERPLLPGAGGARTGGTFGPGLPVLPPELAGWDVSAVPEAELALVRRFLDNRFGYAPDARARLATDLANRIWPFVAGPNIPLHPEHFLETVIYVKSARG